MKKLGRIMDSAIEILICLIVLGIVIFIAVGIARLPSERESDLYACETLDLEWTCTFSDGRSEKITLPANLDVKKGEKISISAVLPEDFGDDSFTRWLGFRSSKHDMEFYIDGVLRGDYSTADTRLWGKYSTTGYVFVPLTAADYGKTITISMFTNSDYTGVIRPVYCGTVFGMWYTFAKGNAFEIISGLLLITMAIASIVISAILNLRLGRRFYLDYLGWGIFFLALWTLAQSPVRQLYFSNVSLASDINYLSLYLFAIPLIMYINYIQNQRHAKIHLSIIAVNLVSLLISAILHFTGTVDFNQVLPIMYVIFLTDIVCSIISVILDVKSGDIKDYSLVISGFIGFAVSAVLQLFEYFNKNSVFNSVFICIGALFILVMAGIDTIKNYMERRKEIDQNLEKAEKLTYQAMITLVHTIEAKDEYTKGHSTRVAEYSRLLAQKAGLGKEEQDSIFYMATLHDIGKIGIADNIINKPGKLTDEEYAVIKTHPETGYDILKNMNEIKDIECGARWHHERFDGKGYPDGLAGEEIPLCARIIAVADTYDAMTSNRSYREVLPQDKVRAEIERVSGTQLDPVIARYMIELIDEDKDYRLRQNTTQNKT
ncbi:MAG: HD-GYP domain-containing protein [Oscillospiraceae bacterium]